MFNEVNFKCSDSLADWLNKPVWHVCEALILLSGGNPHNDIFYRLIDTKYNEKNSIEWIKSFNEKQYDMAIRSIKARELEIEPNESLSGIDKYLRGCVKPNIFLIWAKAKAFLAIT